MGRMKDLLGDSIYPQSPGWRDPVTSRMAAVEIGETAATLRGKVLDELRKHPLTVHATAKALNKPVPSIQPRFSELVAMGKIRWNGELRSNETSGKRAKVWALV